MLITVENEQRQLLGFLHCGDHVEKSVLLLREILHEHPQPDYKFCPLVPSPATLVALSQNSLLTFPRPFVDEIVQPVS